MGEIRNENHTAKVTKILKTKRQRYEIKKIFKSKFFKKFYYINGKSLMQD